MNSPAISVILPAYNCERYIGEAIESVLKQSFPNFEFIIINDGSTDNTERAIHSFVDPRIILINNIKNEGLIYSLNRGISLAHGKFIARMDADDICLPDRFEKQISYLGNNPGTAVLASTIDFIDEQGNKIGNWKLDRQTITIGQIRKMMPYENCIAHPTVMMSSPLVKNLQYKKGMEHIEDYNLWLRILNSNYEIAKIDEPLLQYRIHDKSVTSLHLRANNPFFKHAKMKWMFVWSELADGRFTLFTIHVASTILIDFAKAIIRSFKTIFR